MGSTRLPCNQLIEQERRAWAPFTRALRKAEESVFDRRFDGAKLYVQAGVFRSRPRPFEVIAMAILLEDHKPLERLLAQLERVEVKLSGGGRGSPLTGSSVAAQAGVEPSGAPCLALGLPPPVLVPPGRVRAIRMALEGLAKLPQRVHPRQAFAGRLPEILQTADEREAVGHGISIASPFGSRYARSWEGFI